MFNKSSFCELHRDYDLGLVPSYDLDPTDGLIDPIERPWVHPLEHVSILRFPPGVAIILKSRYLAHLAKTGAEELHTNDTQFAKTPYIKYNPDFIAVSGLTIQPTPKEDFRFYVIKLSVFTDSELAVLKKWHPYVRELRNCTSVETGETEFQLCLYGLLVELPYSIDIYKTLDKTNMVKANQTAQMLLVYFQEDELITVGSPISSTPEHICSLTVNHESQDDYDVETTARPRCPWLYPHGLSTPLYNAREERHRPSLAVKPTEVHAAENAIQAVLRGETEEWLELDLKNSLELFVISEALNRSSVVANSELLLSSEKEIIVGVISKKNQLESLDDEKIMKLFNTSKQSTKQ